MMAAIELAVADRPTSSRTAQVRRVPALFDLAPVEPSFQRFGEWGERVSVARDGTIHHLAHWMATHSERRSAGDRLWSMCMTANPECFREYQVVRLDAPSFFLPQGEVVFTVVENPVQLPDNPP
ncbi:MAG: hypothetical protein ACR2NU_02580, partial [Aeoliella sp.]